MNSILFRAGVLLAAGVLTVGEDGDDILKGEEGYDTIEGNAGVNTCWPGPDGAHLQECQYVR